MALNTSSREKIAQATGLPTEGRNGMALEIYPNCAMVIPYQRYFTIQTELFHFVQHGIRVYIFFCCLIRLPTSWLHLPFSDSLQSHGFRVNLSSTSQPLLHLALKVASRILTQFFEQLEVS